MLGIIGGAVWYEIFSTYTPRFLPLLDSLSGLFGKDVPCAEPIPYKIGTFNTEFGISKEYFLKAIAEAEAVWEKPIDLDLFVYAPEDDDSDVLAINLEYDYRQQVTEKLKTLNTNVKANKDSYDELQLEFAALKENYEVKKREFDRKVESFNQKREALEKEIQYWNSQGGAPEKEFNRLEKERLALDAEARDLEKAGQNLNALASEVNSLVATLNELATSLNLSVEKYNKTIGVERGETFEEGIYQSDGRTREIDVFEFSSREKLVRLLAHEFGHALDIAHLSDPRAIMYSLNLGSGTALGEADLTALRTVCAEALAK